MSPAAHGVRRKLVGKTIDIHSHVGVSIKAYACLEYPCAATVEGIFYRQSACGIDVNVVFPYSADLYFDPVALSAGACVPAERPLSPAPYVIENESLLREVYDYCPEHAGRFLPFISFDPGREVEAQVRSVRGLAARYPIFGIKIHPVLCQSPVTSLLDRGKAILELAHEMNWPILFHTTSQETEEYSRASLAFKVIESNPDVRFCLAHCIGFDRNNLRRADQMPNVWVDTAALAIQVLLVQQDSPIVADAADRFDADYSDHRKVMQALAQAMPSKILWGSDTPAYAYICRRKQGEGNVAEFRLKGRYEDEVNALNALLPELRRKVSNSNSVDFLFGVNGT